MKRYTHLRKNTVDKQLSIGLFLLDQEIWN